MSDVLYPDNSIPSFWMVVRPEPPGQFTAQAVGLPEIQATAANREEAIAQVRAILHQWLTEGRLVSIEVSKENPLLRWSGYADPNDPNEQAYLEELARFRAEDLERTLREYEKEGQQCSDSPSTPTI
jgi:hypothetical protein